jgi:hypothetical protein
LTLKTCQNAIYEQEFEVYFEDQEVKVDIQRLIGNYCKLCVD